MTVENVMIEGMPRPFRFGVNTTSPQYNLDVNGTAELFDVLLGVRASDAFPAQVGLPVMLQVAVIAVRSHGLRPLRWRKPVWREPSLEMQVLGRGGRSSQAGVERDCQSLAIRGTTGD